jgi:hypothetical protein
VKNILISSRHAIPWYRQFPESEPVWGNWRFLFNDPGSKDYSYLVVFDDLHDSFSVRCPRENTIHVATEPIGVCRYNDSFLRQFGLCIHQGEPPKHPHPIPSPPGVNWFIGWDPLQGSKPGAMLFSQIQKLFDEPRTRLISVVTSNKTMTEDHRHRLVFAQKLKEHMGDEIDFYGRGFVTMTDKLQALQGYRFHVVLENTSLEHYFTEKICDCLLAGCYPLYYGCSNIGNYLPQQSLSSIDINDFSASLKTIKRAIDGDYDQIYREEMREGQRRVLYEYNFFPMIVKIIESHQAGKYGRITSPVRYMGKTIFRQRWIFFRGMNKVRRLLHQSD